MIMKSPVLYSTMKLSQPDNIQYRTGISQMIVLLLLASLLFIPDFSQAQSISTFSTPDPLEIVRQSLEQDRMNFERARDYTYIEESRTRRLDGAGRVEKTESETFDVLMLGGRPYKKLIARNGRALSEEQAAKANRDFEKELRKRQEETEKQRREAAEKLDKERKNSRAFLGEIPKAFHFKLVGVEKVDGLAAWVIEAEPRADFRSEVKRAGLLSKFRGKIWIDQRELQWVRVEAETIDTVSFGWVLARLGPGARLTFRQARVNGEVWLPSRATTRLDARVGLVKRINAESEVEWREYRKFRTDSRVVEVGELTDQP